MQPSVSPMTAERLDSLFMRFFLKSSRGLPGNRWLADGAAAMHVPREPVVVEDGEVLHRAVVPDHDVTGGPLVAILETRLLDVVPQFLEQRVAFLARHAVDALGVALAHVKAWLAGA